MDLWTMSVVQLVCVALLFLSCKGQVTITPSSVLTVNEGGNASFSCRGSGPHLLQFNSNVTTNRVNQVSNNDSSGDDGTTVEYALMNALREENGSTIQCFFNGIGSSIVTLVVEFPPQYEPTDSTYRVIEGSSPQLLLDIEAAPRITSYNWTKDGTTLVSDTRRTVRVDGLVFSSVSRDDSGEYVVSAGDSIGTGRATITLDVYYGPVFAEGSKVVNRSVAVGGDITLSCSTNSNPPMSDITLSYTNNGESSNVVQGQTEFRITNAVMGNRGRYTCMAKNEVAIRVLTFNLNVGGPTPTSSSSSVPVPTVDPSSSPTNSPGSGADTFGNVCTLLFSLSLIVGILLTL